MFNSKFNKMKRSKFFTVVALVLFLINSGIAQDNNTSNNDDNYRNYNDDSKRKKYKLGTHHDFKIDLGTNNWLEDGDFPSNNNELYTVRPWGSWYVGLNIINDTHIAGPLHLEWGVGVSWYNFKFENAATRLESGDDTVIFSEAAPEIDSEKSKLTASYVNASFVPVIKFGRSKRRNRRGWNSWHGFRHEGGLRIGAGMYAGYRLGSYTKVKADDNKDRDHGSYYLENIRYGARVQIGYRGLDLFANYDLNEVFVSNRGPQLNAFSFGVIL